MFSISILVVINILVGRNQILLFYSIAQKSHNKKISVDLKKITVTYGEFIEGKLKFIFNTQTILFNLGTPSLINRV